MKETAKSAHQATSPEDRIHLSQLVAYGAGGIIPIALFNVAGILVGLMGNISLGLSAFWLGVILIIPRLVGCSFGPYYGSHLRQYANTLGAPPSISAYRRNSSGCLLCGDVVDSQRERLFGHGSPESGFQWFQLVIYPFCTSSLLHGTTIFEIPHGALGMEMTTDYHERTRLFSAKSLSVTCLQ